MEFVSIDRRIDSHCPPSASFLKDLVSAQQCSADSRLPRFRFRFRYHFEQMSKANAQTSRGNTKAPHADSQSPRVFVVPELMANEPVEAGGLLKEHFESERAKGPGSVRERIEAYLKDPGVIRKLPDEEWPSARTLAGLSAMEKQRWLTLEAQHWLDTGLKKILSGKAPRDVFKLESSKRARPTTAARDRNMCAEVLRLIERCDYSRIDAIERVAEAFSVSVRVVEQSTELWGWDTQGKKERHRFVPLWEQKLRRAGKLK